MTNSATLEHIEAQFLTRFATLVISRIIEHRLNRKYYVGKILESLSKASCKHIQENYYIFHYFDEVLFDIGNELGIDFGKKYIQLVEINKF